MLRGCSNFNGNGADERTANHRGFCCGRQVGVVAKIGGGGASEAACSAWSWIVELSTLADNDADSAEAQLNELFRLGTPPVDLDAPTEGILVMTTTNPALDTVTRAVTVLWMPWQGKRFDADTGTGDNRLTRSTGLVGKLPWPLYSMRDADSGKLAFDFATYG